MDKTVERFLSDFDEFFELAYNQVDSEGLVRCACPLCGSYGSPCLKRVAVPGDVCDPCIEDCFDGQRDITK